MGNLFQDDYDTLGDLRAGAADRERRYDELEEAIPDTAWEDYIRTGARRLGTGASTPADIANRYERDLPGMESAMAGGIRYDDGGREVDALTRLAELSRPGLTAADRSMMDSVRRREDMTARGDREAMLSELEARGMGSSGASLAARMGSAEGAAGRAADANAAMMQSAQARAYDALSAYGSMASHRADRGFGLEGERLSAIDAWNARERDRAAGINARNTERARSDMDTASTAAQREWDNRYRTTTARTSTGERDDERRANQQNAEEERDAEREAQIWEGTTNTLGSFASAAAAGRGGGR